MSDSQQLDIARSPTTWNTKMTPEWAGPTGPGNVPGDRVRQHPKQYPKHDFTNPHRSYII